MLNNPEVLYLLCLIRYVSTLSRQDLIGRSPSFSKIALTCSGRLTITTSPPNGP